MLVLAGAAGVAWFLWQRNIAAQKVTDTVPEGVSNQGNPENDPFYAPYYWTTPGVAPSPIILNGAAEPFQSIINVQVNSDVAQMMARQYIPMFGMVGVTAVGA